ncbi:MAG: hypothetical protein PVH12_08045 [Candidatus Bathyarchaeota archaeon]
MDEKKTILLTTSRRPSVKNRVFCRDLSNIFPNMVRVNRGKHSLDGVAEKALELKTEKVIIVSSWRENIGKIELFEINQSGLKVIPPTIYSRDIDLRKDRRVTHIRRKIQSIAIMASKDSFSEINRFERALSQFLDIPIISFKQVDMDKLDAVVQVSHDYSKSLIVTFKLLPEFIEFGPKVKLSHLVWEPA